MADDMEEDLFADLYDGDETTNPAPTSVAKVEPTAPAPIPTVTHDPGYGEEPESAAAPMNFDNEMAGNGEEDGNEGGQNYNQSYQNSAPSPEPFHLKEDG